MIGVGRVTSLNMSGGGGSQDPCTARSKLNMSMSRGGGGRTGGPFMASSNASWVMVTWELPPLPSRITDRTENITFRNFARGRFIVMQHDIFPFS